ncbi:MAG: hypothetical protein GY754_45140 [bacterium]|nr:hypothetical protein [bacterium]
MTNGNIDIKDLKNTDILLCKSPGKLADFIMKIDGGDYSHAVLYYGDGKIVHSTGFHSPDEKTNDALGEKLFEIISDIEEIPEWMHNEESIREFNTWILDTILGYPKELNGVLEQQLEDLLEKEDYIDVYRFKKGIEEPGLIQKAADKYVTEHPDYAYDHAILGIILALSRKIKMGKLPAFFLRLFMDNLVKHIEDNILLDKDRMACSEFVSRCYLEAAPDNKYAIVIERLPFHQQVREIVTNTALVEKTSEEVETVKESMERLLDIWPRPKEAEIKDGDYYSVPNAISPHDLEASPSLEKIGRLKK